MADNHTTAPSILWVAAGDRFDLPLTFYLFDAGVIEDPARINLQEEELTSFEFLPSPAAVPLLADFNQPRVALAIEARRTGTTIYQPSYAGPSAARR